MKANIEKLKDSVINHDVNFHWSGFENCRDLMKFRRKNIKITNMCWITKRPVIDYGDSLYNPTALIMLILN